MQHTVNYGSSSNLTGELMAGCTVKMCFTAEATDLKSVHIDFATYKRRNASSLKIELLSETGQKIASTTISALSLQDNRLNEIALPCALLLGERYTIVLVGLDGEVHNSVTAKYGKKQHPETSLWVNGLPLKKEELHVVFDYSTGGAEKITEVIPVVEPKLKTIHGLTSICIIVNEDKDAQDNSGQTFLQEMVQSFVDCGKDRRLELIVVDWKKSVKPVAKWLYERVARYFPVNLISMKGAYSWGAGAQAAEKEARGDVLAFLHPHMLANEGFFLTIDKVLSSKGAILPESLAPSPKWTYTRGNLIVHRDLLDASPGWSDEVQMFEFLNACSKCSKVCEQGLRTLLQEEQKEEFVPASYVTLGGGKLATFCLALKSRSAMAMESVKSLVTKVNVPYFNFIISEDESDDMLDLSEFPLAKHIAHYVVSTGEKWNRSKLCNYGFARAHTPIVVSWDADFIFPQDFAKNFIQSLLSTNFSNAFLRIPVTETETMKRGDMEFQRGTLYGGMYAYGYKELSAIGGYDETFTLYGYEEKDANSRLVMSGVVEKVVTRKGYVFHKSHGDSVRGDMTNYDINKKKAEDHIRQNVVKVNTSGWGKTVRVRRENYDKTIIVMGNGPSLKHFNFDLMKYYDCIGMNISYRHFHKIGIYPRYHTCFDRIVTDNHAQGFKEYIEDPLVTTERFFLLSPVTQSPKLTVVHLYPEEPTFSTRLDHFQNSGNTGTNSCQVALCLGYKRIILVGVDCNYVQLVDGAKIVEGTVIEMEKTPEANPNYFIPDYQQKGDRFNVPNAHIYHQPAWERFSKYAKLNGIEVVNCGLESKLECFRRSTLEDEGVLS